MPRGVARATHAVHSAGAWPGMGCQGGLASSGFLSQSSSCVPSGSLEEVKPALQVLFQTLLVLLLLMSHLANIPLAKASHTDEPRVKVEDPYSRWGSSGQFTT